MICEKYRRHSNYVPVNKTFEQYVSGATSSKPKVSKRLRPWFISISWSTVNQCNFVSMGWLLSRVRINFASISKAYRKFLDEKKNYPYIEAQFGAETFDKPYYVQIPTELVVETIRLFHLMVASGDYEAHEIFRYYNRKEKRRHARYKCEVRKYKKLRSGSHNRWSAEGRDRLIKETILKMGNAPKAQMTSSI